MSKCAGPFEGYVWRRGALLGLQWLGVFTLVTIALYGVLGLVGWAGVTRALCALFTGPVLGTVGIVVWWLVRRPVLAPRAPSQGVREVNSIHDRDDSHPPAVL